MVGRVWVPVAPAAAALAVATVLGIPAVASRMGVLTALPKARPAVPTPNPAAAVAVEWLGSAATSKLCRTGEKPALLGIRSPDPAAIRFPRLPLRWELNLGLSGRAAALALWYSACLGLVMLLLLRCRLCVWCSRSPRFARLPDMLTSLPVSEASRADRVAADLWAATSAARAVGAPLYTRVVRASPVQQQWVGKGSTGPSVGGSLLRVLWGLHLCGRSGFARGGSIRQNVGGSLCCAHCWGTSAHMGSHSLVYSAQRWAQCCAL